VRSLVRRIESDGAPRTAVHSVPDDLPRLPDALREAWLLLRRQGDMPAQCVAASLGLRVEAARDRLSRLVHAGWATQERDGRRVRYACVLEGGSCP
jgi:DNA-binding transcriptional ArsR family regulator